MDGRQWRKTCSSTVTYMYIPVLRLLYQVWPSPSPVPASAPKLYFFSLMGPTVAGGGHWQRRSDSEGRDEKKDGTKQKSKRNYVLVRRRKEKREKRKNGPPRKCLVIVMVGWPTPELLSLAPLPPPRRGHLTGRAGMASLTQNQANSQMPMSRGWAGVRERECVCERECACAIACSCARE